MYVVTVLAADVQFGNVAEWVAALGTVAAFLATFWLLRHEVRARHADESERRWQQARLVTTSHGSTTTWGAPEGGMSAEFEVHNDSAEPITVVNAEAVITRPDGRVLPTLGATARGRSR